MKIKYIALILLFLLSAGMVCAAEVGDFTASDFKNIKFSDKDTDVELHGFEFTIPKGYGPVEHFDIDETSEDGVRQESKFYSDEDGNVIQTAVLSGDGLSKDLDVYATIADDPQKTSISGKDGILWESEGYQFFVYIEDDCVIMLQAKDANIFEDIIV